MYLSNLKQDDVFVDSEMKSMSELTQMKSRKGLENVIVSNGKIVNVVSKSYGHVPNQIFFRSAQKILDDAGLRYRRQSINRDDRSFVVDFIIEDRGQFSLKNQRDKVLPMLRFKNSYDGSEKTSGHFGFYREVCSNGLHVAQSQLEFSIKHSRSNIELLVPSLKRLFQRFLYNEFYTIMAKFKRMQQIEIIDTRAFVKEILERTKLFRYECSDKNPDPSKKSREVLEILDFESIMLDDKPNLWLGYNAFNGELHHVLKKGFSQQEKLDRKIFEAVLEMV